LITNLHFYNFHLKKLTQYIKQSSQINLAFNIFNLDYGF